MAMYNTKLNYNGEPCTWRHVSTVRGQALGNLPQKCGKAPSAEPTTESLCITSSTVTLPFEFVTSFAIIYKILSFLFFPLVAPTTFGPDLIMSPRKVSWLFMQGFTIKYYPCEAEGGDFVVNRQA